MKQAVIFFSLLLTMGLFSGCSNDDIALSGVERSLLGCWQIVEKYSYRHQQPVEGAQVIVFNPDRTQLYYQDGQLQSESQFWTKPIKDYNGYLYHQPDEADIHSTYSCIFEVVGNQLTIWSFGCFNESKTVCQRIPSLNGANPQVGVYKYEDNPTSLEGTWHLAKVSGAFDQEHEVPAGEVTVYFTNHTMQVVNGGNGNGPKDFMDSGIYSCEIIKRKTNKYDNAVYTTIYLDGTQRTCYFKDGMMILDFGTAYDAPAYLFKKLEFAK